jgi:hypothetical protein
MSVASLARSESGMARAGERMDMGLASFDMSAGRRS